MLRATDRMVPIILIQLAAISRIPDAIPVVVDDPRVLDQEAERIDLACVSQHIQ
jgi:hypothetical protein